jgi:hypothetical protein
LVFTAGERYLVTVGVAVLAVHVVVAAAIYPRLRAITRPPAQSRQAPHAPSASGPERDIR